MNRKKMQKFLFMAVVASSMLYSCSQSEEEVVAITASPTVSFSEEDMVYEVKINKTITIEPQLTDVVDGFFVWNYNGKIVGRDSVYEFSSSELGQHFLTFTVEAANGSCTEEIRVDVLETTPPVIYLPLETGYIRATENRETEIIPTYKYCDEETTYAWYIDGEFIADTETITVNYSDLNDYSIRLDVANEDGFTRSEAILRISEVPSLAFDFDQDSYYVAVGSSIVLAPYVSYNDDSTTYSWSVDGTTQSSTTKFLTFTPSAVGSYTVKISGTSDENSASSEVTIKCVEAIDYSRAITAESSNNVTVYEFTAAPGQYTNTAYSSNGATTAEEAAAYAESRFNAGSLVSLGGWGGYVIAGFDHSIQNVDGAKDLWVGGNAFTTSNEPAIVWVMQDVNGDGLPNDIWYELKGSEYGQEGTVQDYVITYYKGETGENIRWTDNCGDAGTVDVNSFYSQNYFPYWITEESYTIMGTKIKSRTEDMSSSTGSEYWSNSAFEWGYADNAGSDYANSGTEFELDNAVNRDGTPANLTHIDFVKVQAAVNAKAGSLGEVSPEVTGFANLNL